MRKAIKGILLLSLACTLLSCSGKDSKDSGGKGEGSSANAESKGSGSQGSADKSGSGGVQSSDVVKIPLADQQKVGIQVQEVFVERVPRVLSVAGQVQMDEQHTSHLGTIADGRITAVNVLPGAQVRRGQQLGELHSHMVHETVGALVQAYAEVDRQRGAVAFAKQAQERYHHLYSLQAASLEESQRADQELLQAQKMLADGEANVRMEREHLAELLQVSPESLQSGNLYDKELVPMRSSIDGAVMARNVTVGQVVPTGFEAFVVSNLTTVWVTAAVNEKDLSLIHIGAPAEVVTQGYADQRFPGRVGMIGDMLDPQTRTVPVRIVVPNRKANLRPGMFATASIAEPQSRTSIFVPEDALQDINGMKVVFATNDGVTFQAKTVNVGARSQGKAEIVNGLSAKDRIVVKGAFVVKSEMLKGTMGEG